MENRFKTKISTLFSDNGGEFIAPKSFLSNVGITHLKSPPQTPEHIGVSERKYRHIVETCLTLLTHAGMSTSYWTYAFAAAVYLINRLPTLVLDMESPYQKLFREDPNYDKLRVFGCLCLPWLRPYTTNKFDNRSTLVCYWATPSLKAPISAYNQAPVASTPLVMFNLTRRRSHFGVPVTNQYKRNPHQQALNTLMFQFFLFLCRYMCRRRNPRVSRLRFLRRL